MVYEMLIAPLKIGPPARFDHARASAGVGRAAPEIVINLHQTSPIERRVSIQGDCDEKFEQISKKPRRGRRDGGLRRDDGACRCASAEDKKPNILVIMGDDIGYWNISAYNRGMMGYHTPNIDRIANEGAIFTDYYAQQSCTAGRAAFITGQSPIRTGLLKVGLPSAKEGLSDKDPTLAELLKPQGYVTGQFGKNHLGDRNEFLPTVHGFDEFFGNLYHLNAEEEPENPDYPKASEYPNFRKNFGPRGVLHCFATDDRDARRRPAIRRLGQAEMRGYRAAHQKADGDGRRGIPRRLAQLHRPRQQGQEAVLRLVQFDAHAHLHASEAGIAGRDRPRRPIRTAWSSTTAWSARS